MSGRVTVRPGELESVRISGVDIKLGRGGFSDGDGSSNDGFMFRDIRCECCEVMLWAGELSAPGLLALPFSERRKADSLASGPFFPSVGYVAGSPKSLKFSTNCDERL